MDKIMRTKNQADPLISILHNLVDKAREGYVHAGDEHRIRFIYDDRDMAIMIEQVVVRIQTALAKGDISVVNLIKEITDWSTKQFPNATPQGLAEHLFSEAEELVNNPTDKEEMADIFMLLAHVVHKTGTDIIKAVEEKLEKNKQRKWGKENEKGFIEHIKEADNG